MKDVKIGLNNETNDESIPEGFVSWNVEKYK